MSRAASELVRELDCETRTFRTVKGCILWFQEYDYRRCAIEAPPLEAARAPQSRATRVRRQNTYAMLLLALTPTAPGVDEFVLHHIELLPEWFRAWEPQRNLAIAWGFPSLRALRQTMRFTEAVLEHRLRERGLLR